jgi:ABC-type nitrate/sulfonate/bicarbonate transport system ATPase subunit
MAAKIVASDVWKAFRRNGTALSVVEGVTLTVGEGEVVALVGPSGCGKSTLLDMLAGFTFPDRGSVQVDGRPVRGPDPNRILISQGGSVFPWLTVRRNLVIVQVGVPPDERRARAKHYMDVVGLGDFQLAYPYQLSGGMRQRLELARALVVRPQMLLMDEPFGALDALTRLRMRAEFLHILERERHTVLLVTHDVEEALHLADRIVVMTARPARIQDVVDVPDPHPRNLTSPAFSALKDRILHELGVDAWLNPIVESGMGNGGAPT